MRITVLKSNPLIYTCNSYLIRGDNNSLSDVNSLIDTGSDGYVIDEIKSINTGAGKKIIDAIFVTHCHFDHTGGIKHIKKAFNSLVYSYHCEPFTDIGLKDDDMVKMGDSVFHVIHTPGHSQDSVCFYNYDQKVLFSGDTPIDINSSFGSYSVEFIEAFERLASLKVQAIYPGHGAVISESAESILKNSFMNIRKASLLKS